MPVSVFLAESPASGLYDVQRQGADERGHLIRADQLAILWIDPRGQVAPCRSESPDRVGALVPGIFSTETLRGLGTPISEEGNRPWELKAFFLPP